MRAMRYARSIGLAAAAAAAATCMQPTTRCEELLACHVFLQYGEPASYQRSPIFPSSAPGHPAFPWILYSTDLTFFFMGTFETGSR